MMGVAHGPLASEGRVGSLPFVCESAQQLTLLVVRPLSSAQHNAVPYVRWGSGQALRLILAPPKSRIMRPYLGRPSPPHCSDQFSRSTGLQIIQAEAASRLSLILAFGLCPVLARKRTSNHLVT